MRPPAHFLVRQTAGQARASGRRCKVESDVVTGGSVVRDGAANVNAEAATRICLVRHGETDWNVGDRIQGNLDIELNAVGLKQAAAVGRRLATESWDALYSSDLARARQTAECIGAATNHEVRLLPAFRERRYGLFEGLTRTQVRERFPLEYAAVERRDSETVPPGDGESLSAHFARIAAALQTLADVHVGQRILVVTHGGVLDLVNRFVRRLPLDTRRDFLIPNTGINRVVRDVDGWRITEWGDVRHLADAGRDELM
ncbi:histidine phosphatase family protein [Rhodocyclus tenuis]|nr:histidine phosphatase family protein [Rhodocyclus gracilis]